MKRFFIALFLLLGITQAHANVPCTLPNNLTNGTIADATQVMANYNSIITCLTKAAAAGANNDITSLTALVNSITNGNLAQMPASTVKCNPAGATGSAQDCTIGNNLAFTGSTLNTNTATIASNQYGTVCNGGADDSNNLLRWQNAINASTAANVYAVMGPGNCQLSSSTVPNGIVFTRSWVTVDCQGATITVTGVGMMNAVFSTVDQSHIKYKNCNFIGNSVATTFALGGAISFTNSAASIQDLVVEDNTFTNFGGDYWVYIETLGTFANSIQNVNINRNAFVSQTGNCRGPTNIAINCSFVLVYGVGQNGGVPTPNSFTRSIHVTNNFMKADYVKTGVQLFNNVQDAVVSGNLIYNAGQLGGITDDHGAYAIMIYENESPSTTSFSAHAIIENNYIFNVRDNGVYMAGQWTDSVINGNVVNTQTSVATATLPKGGISVNGGVGTTITGNRVINIAADGITLVANQPAATDGEWMIANNFASSNLNGAIRLLNTAQNGATKVSVLNNNLVASGTAYGVFAEIFSGSVPGSLYNNLTISGNNITGGVVGIRLFADSGSLTFNGLSVTQNHLSGQSNTGIDISQITTVNGGPVLLEGNSSCCAVSVANYNITNTIGLVAQNNACAQQNSGNCWTTAGAQGTLKDNSFDRVANVVATIGTTDLGRVKPTWTAFAQTEVQNFAAAETGTAPNKYLVRSWFYNVSSATWVDERVLTGN